MGPGMLDTGWRGCVEEPAGVSCVVLCFVCSWSFALWLLTPSENDDSGARLHTSGC